MQDIDVGAISGVSEHKAGVSGDAKPIANKVFPPNERTKADVEVVVGTVTISSVVPCSSIPEWSAKMNSS